MRKITKFLSLIVMLILAVTLIACDDPIELSFEEETIELEFDGETQLEFNVSDETLKLEWSVDDDKVLEISQTGFVKALKAGTATVTVKVKDEEVEAKITVTVKEKPIINPTAVAIEGAVEEGKVGASFTLTAKVLPVGADQTVTWASSNNNVATVTDAGVVTLVGIGKAFITAKSTKDTTKEKEIEISVIAPDPLSITITSEGNLTEVNVFATLQFSAVTSPDLASNEVTWSVSDDALASIDETGKLTAKQVGTVTVTATSTVVTSVKNTFEVVILQPEPTEVVVQGEGTLLAKDEEFTLSVSVVPAIAIQTVTYTSSAEAVATVDENGKITAVGAGEAIITIATTAKPSVVATFNVEVVDTSLLDYDLTTIILDNTLTALRFEKVIIDEKDYYMGLNAFASAADAFAALEEDSTLIVKKGTYEEAGTIKVNGVKVLGPNVGRPAGKDLSNRFDEAVFTKVITLDGVQDVLFDGIALTGVAQIRSTKPVKNITVQNLNGFAHNVPASEGVITGLVDTSAEFNENYVVKYSRFVDTFGGGPALGYRGVRINNAKNIEITDNYFVGFFDSIRLETEKNVAGGYGASGNITILRNEFENNFQYSIWIGAYQKANVEINDNYIASRPEYTGVYGHIYLVGFNPTAGEKTIVNVLRNVMPYRVSGWHQLRFNSNAATPEELEINANYNIFHESAGEDDEGIYTHIADHYSTTDTGFRVNGINNYYLYETEIKAAYFLRANYEPTLTELPDELQLNQLLREIPEQLMDDYVLPVLDGVTWALKEGEDATLYDVATGELLRLPVGAEQLVVVATLNETTLEVGLKFSILRDGFSQFYYNSSDSFAAATGGTFETQTARAGFGGYTVIVDNKQFFLGEKSYISLVGETEDQEFTKEQLRPLGLGSTTELYNNGLVTGGVVSTNQRGYGVLYENTGTVSIKFNLSFTYGRNNAAFAGYGKIKFVPQADGTYKVMAHEADSGTNTTDEGTQITLAPGEMLYCPHTWDTKSGTYFSSPKVDFEGGVLAEDAIIKIEKFKAVFAEPEE